MTIIEVARDGHRVGLLIFFAVHPTVLYHGAPIYSSDFVGRAVTALEREAPTGPDGRFPVVAFFNGAEGDIVPKRGVRDLREVDATARSFEHEIRVALSGQTHALTAAAIRVRQEFVHPCPNDCAGFALAAKGVFGAAALGGGEDDRTALYQLGWKEGQHDIPSDRQGPKLPGLDSALLPIVKTTDALSPKSSLPSELPIAYVELGQFADVGVFSLGAFPAEISSAQAAAIRQKFEGHGHFEIVGLANEYTSYVATVDEYAAQDYMAASTIWGPDEGIVFKQTIEALATSAEGPLSFAARRYDAGPKPEVSLSATKLGIDAIGVPLPAPDDGLGRILLNAAGAPERNLPFFEWCEAVLDDGSEVAASQRRVEIQTNASGTWTLRTTPEPDDDRGIGLLTMLRDAGGHGPRRWAVLWLAPVIESKVPAGTYRFRVTTRTHDGSRIDYTSKEFTVNLQPALRQDAVGPLGPNGCQ